MKEPVPLPPVTSFDFPQLSDRTTAGKVAQEKDGLIEGNAHPFSRMLAYLRKSGYKQRQKHTKQHSLSPEIQQKTRDYGIKGQNYIL